MQNSKLQIKIQNFIKIKSYKLKANKGFTLIEILVYIAVLVIVLIVAINSFIVFSQAYAKSKADRDTLVNAQAAMDAILREIKYADSIYLPTSCFGDSDIKSVCGGSKRQLSLGTVQNLPADESKTFVDFYLDNYKIYVKREGQSSESITTDKVKVSDLQFTRLVGGVNLDQESVRVQMSVEYNSSASHLQASTTLYSTASLR